jgi:tetratricopeptide (TPR) repeat protein
VEARALANLAALAYDERDSDAAIERYEEALAVLEAIADERQLALTAMNLAVLLQETGQRKSAREHYQRAVACFERLGDARLCGIALSNFGMLELEDGALDAAVQAQQRAQRLLAQSGDERSEALCWGRLGASLSASGDVRGAIVAFRKADRMTARRDLAARQTVRVYGAFLDLARARQAQQGGRTTQADQALHAAFARIREADHPSDDGTPPVSTHSDDVRTALRVLHEQISAFEFARPTSQ